MLKITFGILDAIEKGLVATNKNSSEITGDTVLVVSSWQHDTLYVKWISTRTNRSSTII